MLSKGTHSIAMSKLSIRAGRGVQRFSHQTILADGVPYEVTTGWCVLPKLERETRNRRRWIRLPQWVLEREIEPIEDIATRSAALAPDCRGRRRLLSQTEIECEVDRGVRLPEYDTAAFYQFKINLSRVSSQYAEDGSTISLRPRLTAIEHFRL